MTGEGDSAVTQRTRTFGAALVALTTGFAVVAAKPSQSVLVTSTIVDNATYQIGSDGLGPYKNGSGGNGVSAILADGDYQLGSFYQSGATRTVTLTFDDPGEGIAGSGPNGGAPVAPPDGKYIVNIASDCSDGASPAGSNYLNVLPGSPIECGMNVHFAYGGQTYDLHEALDGGELGNFPETNPVKITCTSAAGNPCSAWTVQPSAASGQNVANLSIEKTVKGKLTYVKQGDFLVSFLITMTHP
jgi:hypothetical protein